MEQLSKGSVLKLSNIKKQLWLDISLFILLTGIGWFSIFTIEYNSDQNIWIELIAFKKNYARQALWIIISILLSIIILNTRSKWFISSSSILYFFGIFVMLLIAINGRNHRGSYSWIKVGPINIQFAVIMLFFTLLFLSKYIASLNFHINKARCRVLAILIFMLPCILTISQKELGFALVFLALLIVLYREGIPNYFIIIPLYIVIIAICSIALSTLYFTLMMMVIILLVFLFFKRRLLQNKVFLFSLIFLMFITVICHTFIIPFVLSKSLAPYQLKRVYSTFHKSNDMALSEIKVIDRLQEKKRKRNDHNYNVSQSIIAIGSGSLFGKGFLKNTQTRLNFVPEQSTDFILCSFAESFGFVGIFILLILYVIIIFRILKIGESQRNIDVRCYAYGVGAIMLFHFTVNVGMVIGALPVIGIPLPFMSYGGSSLVTFSFMYFLLLRFNIDKQIIK